MNFKKWVKRIQTAGYNGARTVYDNDFCLAKITKLAQCAKCWLQVAAGSQECLGSLVTSKTRQFLDLDKIHEFDRNAKFWGAKQRIQKITCKASVKFFEFRKVFRVEQTRFYDSQVS